MRWLYLQQVLHHTVGSHALNEVLSCLLELGRCDWSILVLFCNIIPFETYTSWIENDTWKYSYKVPSTFLPNWSLLCALGITSMIPHCGLLVIALSCISRNSLALKGARSNLMPPGPMSNRNPKSVTINVRYRNQASDGGIVVMEIVMEIVMVVLLWWK